MVGLTGEEKKKFLRALEEDVEFRYAVMGLLGFKEILDRITRIEEREQKIEERIILLEERFAELEKRFARLEERQQGIEERMIEVLTELRDLRRLVYTIAHRFVILTESAFREAMKHIIEESLGVGRVYKKSLRDDRGIVYGYPSIIDVDVVIRDNRHILVEIKSRVSRSDVSELYRIGKLYEEIEGIKPELVIIGGFIDPDAYEATVKLGVVVKPALKE